MNLEVDKAVEEYNQSHEKKFYCVTLQSEAAGVAAHPTRSEFLPVIDIDVPLVSLPNATTNFLQDRRGFAFYAGGRNFTRDFILLSYQKGIPFGIMEMKDMNGALNGASCGASHEKARIYHEQSFKDAEGMKKLAENAHLFGPDAVTQSAGPSALPGDGSLFGYFFLPRPQQKSVRL